MSGRITQHYQQTKRRRYQFSTPPKLDQEMHEQRTPKEKSPLSAQFLKENGVDIGWDNNSPSPTVPLQANGKKKKTTLRSVKNGQDLSSMIQKITKKKSQASAAGDGEGLLLSTWMKQESSTFTNKTKCKTEPSRHLRKASKSSSDHKLEGFQLKTNLQKFLEEVSVVNYDLQEVCSNTNVLIADDRKDITPTVKHTSEECTKVTIQNDNRMKYSENSDKKTKVTPIESPIELRLLHGKKDNAIDSLILGDLDDFGADLLELCPEIRTTNTIEGCSSKAATYIPKKSQLITPIRSKSTLTACNSKQVPFNRKITLNEKSTESIDEAKRTSGNEKLVSVNEDSLLQDFSFGDDDADVFIKASQLVENAIKCSSKRKASKSPGSKTPILCDGNDSLAGIFEFPENDVILIEDNTDTKNDFTKVKSKTRIVTEKPSNGLLTNPKKKNDIVSNESPISSQSSIVDGIELNSDDDLLLDDMLTEFEEEAKCKSQEAPPKINTDQRKLLKRCHTSPYPIKSKSAAASTNQDTPGQPRKKIAIESTAKRIPVEKSSTVKDFKDKRKDPIKQAPLAGKPSCKVPHIKNSNVPMQNNAFKEAIPVNNQRNAFDKSKSSSYLYKKPAENLGMRRNVPTRPNPNSSSVAKKCLPIDLSVIGSPGAKEKIEEKDVSILNQVNSTQMAPWASTQRCSTLDILKKREEAQRKLKEKMKLKHKAAVH